MKVSTRPWSANGTMTSGTRDFTIQKIRYYDKCSKVVFIHYHSFILFSIYNASLEIIKSWYDRQDSDGWIQREQILGEEARSRVPEQFQIQYPEHANPPTLLYAISGYLDRLSNVTNIFSVGAFGNADQAQFSSDFAGGEQDVQNARLADTDLAKQYLAELYPKLRTNYEWMRRTMQGGIREYGRTSRSRVEGYRWRGRTRTHTLTSGLDDYPRADLPSVAELHVDLLSWIGFMSRNLQRIASIVGEEDDAEEYEDHYKAIVHNVEGNLSLVVFTMDIVQLVCLRNC